MSGRTSGLKLVVAALAATTAFHWNYGAGAADGRTIVVEIRDFAFVPEIPTVSPGDIVVWRNLDIVPHTATADDESWDSGLIEANGEWSLTITDDMGETYYCRFHPSMVAGLEIARD